jgi:hypothetical protein
MPRHPPSTPSTTVLTSWGPFAASTMPQHFGRRTTHTAREWLLEEYCTLQMDQVERMQAAGWGPPCNPRRDIISACRTAATYYQYIVTWIRFGHASHMLHASLETASCALLLLAWQPCSLPYICGLHITTLPAAHTQYTTTAHRSHESQLHGGLHLRGQGSCRRSSQSSSLICGLFRLLKRKGRE